MAIATKSDAGISYIAGKPTTTKTTPAVTTPKVTTPKGSVSQAVVAGRADPVPPSNVKTNNTYYTTYDGSNRTAVDSKTGQTVGSASGAYNQLTPTNYGNGADNGSSGSGGGSTESYDYMSAMMDLLKAQYDAQERARQAKLEALYKSNNESADRQIGLYNNQANRNNKQIANLTKGGTNGAMLSSQLQNNLWRDNGINKAINTRDLANANEESASYATQASNIGTLMNSANNIMSNLGSLDAESQRKLISRLEDIYR